MEALSEVVRQGKARYLGFSEWTPPQIQAALDLPGVERFVSSQPRVLAAPPQAGARCLDVCAANGISQIVWSPLAQGVLTGKYRAGDPAARRVAGNARSAWAGRSGATWRRRSWRGRAAAADRRRARDDACSARARVGAPRAERRSGDRRRQPPRAAAGERGGVRRGARRGDPGSGRRGPGRRRGRLIRIEPLAQKRRKAAAVVRLPAALLPAASCNAGSGVKTRMPMPMVMFAPQLPEQAPPIVAVMTAPDLLERARGERRTRVVGGDVGFDPVTRPAGAVRPGDRQLVVAGTARVRLGDRRARPDRGRDRLAERDHERVAGLHQTRRETVVRRT